MATLMGQSLTFWDLMFPVLLSIVAFALALMNGRIAANHGYSYKMGFWLGMFLPGVGIGIIYLLPEM